MSKNSDQTKNEPSSSFPWKALASAAVGRGGVALLFRPMEVARIRVLDYRINPDSGLADNPYKSGGEYFKSLYGKVQEKGLVAISKELYGGIAPRVMQAMSRESLRMGTLFQADRVLGSSEKDKVKGVIKAAAVASADVLVMPLDTLGVHMASEGKAGFYHVAQQYRSANTIPKILKVMYPSQIVGSVVSKQLTQAGALIIAGDYFNHLLRDKEGKMTASNTALSSLATGSLSATVTYPCDLYKSWAQLNNGQYSLGHFFKDCSQLSKPNFPAGRAFMLRLVPATASVAIRNISRLFAQEEHISAPTVKGAEKSWVNTVSRPESNAVTAAR